MNRLIAVAAILLAAGCSAEVQPPQAPPTLSSSSSTSSTSAVPKFTMNGAFNIDATGSGLADGAACRGQNYAEAEMSTPVRVYDQQGKLLAEGHLPEGRFSKNALGEVCTFKISVDNVPDGPPMYSVAVGNHGGQEVSSAAAHRWFVLHP